jgi:hypothetical protein
MDGPGRVGDQPTPDATAALWRRLDRPFDLPGMVDVLMGLRPEVTDALAAVKLCVSSQASDLLAAMPNLSRSLATSVNSHAIRSRGEIRGPVLWSETMSARASSFGDEDLFVCTAPQRDYDVPANRALVQALRTLTTAGHAIERAPQRWRGDERVDAARAVARRAHKWVEHPSLSRVTRERVHARDLKRVRGGKSAARYAPALAVLDVAAEPLGPVDLVTLCDRRTRLQHWVLLAVVQELEQRGLAVPPFRAEGAALLAGPVSYVHARHRMGAERLHGILLGHVLIDVAYPPARPVERGSSSAGHLDVEEELVARGNGRTVAVIRSYRDVQAVVDVAIKAARDVLAGVGPRV